MKKENTQHPLSVVAQNRLRSDFFSTADEILRLRITETASKNKYLPLPDILGKFDDQSHYLRSLDVLRNSSLEVEHQNEVFIREILPKIKRHDKLLDVGVGNGEVSQFFGQLFSNVTVVDTSADSLRKIPDYHWLLKNRICKIEGSILDIELGPNQYDLILLSHLLYYIPESSFDILFKKTHEALAPGGMVLVVYNSGGDRVKITEEFGGKNHNLDSVEAMLAHYYAHIKSIVFQEKIQAVNLDMMLHVMEVFLNDANTTAQKTDIVSKMDSYLEDDVYSVSMITHIVAALKEENEGC